MSRATPRLREVSKALMAYETSINKTSADGDFPAFVIAEKFRPHLANLMGVGGFRALLSRALVLAEEEVSWLRDVHVSPAGRLESFEKPTTSLESLEFIGGNEVIVAQMLGLLVAFIGPNLTLQQITAIWPDFSVTMSVMANEEVQNEKTNQAAR